MVAVRSAALRVLTDEPDLARPRTRADCAGVPRPCPWVGCRHHVADVVVSTLGRVCAVLGVALPASADEAEEAAWLDRVADAIASMDPDRSCSLDLADRDEMTPEAVGKLLGVSRERVRQIECEARRTLRARRRVRPLRR